MTDNEMNNNETMNESTRSGARTGGPSETKRSPLLWIGVVAVALAATALIIVLSMKSCGGNGWNYDNSATAGQAPNKSAEEIRAELDRIVEEGMFDISIASVIDFETPASSGAAYIENVPGNNFDLSVDIVLSGTDELVYSSGPIAPNNYIENITLDRELSPGTYPAIARFHAYDRNTHEEEGTAAAQVTLIVGDVQ